MQIFTGMEYIYIALANAMGMDGLNWEPRIALGKLIAKDPDKYLVNAEKPLYMHKALYAHADAMAGNPTGFQFALDATASGLQVMAALSGCHVTAANVNLIDTGNRESAYDKVASTLSATTGSVYNKSDVKDPVMTRYYGSKAEPKRVFGEDTEVLAQFYGVLATEFPGAEMAMSHIGAAWNPNGVAHTWKTPDGHVSYVPVKETVTREIVVEELGGSAFEHTATVYGPAFSGTSLQANVIHSIDGYIVREMYRRASKQGFEIMTNHDAFHASPNNMNQVRQNYNDILAEIAKSNLLSKILRQLTGVRITFPKLSHTLGSKIRKANYSLS